MLTPRAALNNNVFALLPGRRRYPARESVAAAARGIDSCYVTDTFVEGLRGRWPPFFLVYLLSKRTEEGLGLSEGL